MAASGQTLFVENNGQVRRNIPFAPEHVLFYAHFSGMSVFIQPDGITYQHNDGKFHSQQQILKSRVRMSLKGAFQPSAIIAEEKSNLTERHFNPEENIVMESASFGKVILKNVYENIDWVIYAKNGSLKYDFIIHPGGNPDAITFGYENAEQTQLLNDGSISIASTAGFIRECAPVTFCNREIVGSHFVAKANGYGFSVPEYDKNYTLTIDPDVVWSSYIGGSGFDEARHSVVDEEGYIYVTGMTSATSGISVNGFQSVYGGGNYDAFIAKFSKDGQLIWASYFGGAQSDFGNAIVLDAQGNIYVAGSTSSNNSLISGGATTTYGGGNYDGFILKLSSSGQFLWSSYIGGSAEDTSWSVDVNSEGRVIVLSSTASNNALINGVHQLSNGGGTDLLLTCFNPSGAVLWSSYFGGAGTEEAGNVLFGPAETIYVCGSTSSAGFAVNGTQTTFGGGGSDGILAHFTAEGATIWSTYIGGSGDDNAHQISINQYEQLYVSGSTSSTSGIATAGAQQATNNGGSYDAFVGRYALSGEKLWMTYFGGEGQDRAFGCAVDELGSVYIGGITSSVSNITANPFQQDNGGGTDLFFAFYDSLGVKNWSSYLGGIGDEFLRSISPDENSKIIYCGNTASSATALNGWDTSYGGGTDGFFGKVQDCDNPYVTVDPLGETTFCFGENAGLSVGGADSFLWSTMEIATVISVDTTQLVYAIGTINATGCRALSNVVFIEALYTPTVTAYAEGPTDFCEFGEVVLHAETEDEYEIFVWNTSETGASIVVTTAGSYTVGAEAENGCIGRSEPIVVTITPAPEVAAAIAVNTTCISTSAVNVVGVPFGGEFVGNGMVGNTFIPEIAGGGEHMVQYQYTDPETGCVGYSDQMIIEVLFEEVMLFVDQTEFCIYDLPMDLFGFPEGGFFIGPGVSESTFFPELAGPGIHEIAYVYYDENGCANRSEQLMTVDFCTNVSEAEKGPSFTVWPNPAAEEIFILSSGQENISIRIHDISGKEVIRHQNHVAQSPIDISALHAGIYIVSAENEGHILQKKFVKL